MILTHAVITATVTRQNSDRRNPGLAFVHGPGFDVPGFDGVRVRVRVWVRVRVGLRSALGFWLKLGFGSGLGLGLKLG